jgi:hypothetical protein
MTLRLQKKVNLSFIIEVKSFPRQLIKVIALKLSRSFTSPLFLYIGLIMPIVQLSGIIPESKTRLKIFLKTRIYSEGEFFRYSFKTLSSPGDLLFFSPFNASTISFSVISPFKISL